MFDGIKLAINDPVTNAHLLNIFDFISSNKESGEVIHPSDKTINPRFKYKYAECKSFKFKLFDSGRLEITGSLHYYFNNGRHNHNQFTLKDVYETINRFCQEFKINPLKARIHNLEFGANVSTPFTPDFFINNVVSHKTNNFNMMDIKDGYGKTSVCAGKQYGLKIYNKGIQFGTGYNNLRYEFKCLKMELICKKAVYLADLLTPAIIDRCKNLLINSFNDLIIMEPVSGLNNKDHEFYLQYINPNYHKKPVDKYKRHRDKEKYNQLMVRYSTERIKENTLKLLIQTILNLTIEIPEKRNLLTDIVKPNLQPFDHLDKLAKGCKTLKANKQPVKCISCGRDISNQKAGSFYCSEKLFGSAAKKCRNNASNPRNNYKKKIKTINLKGTLFDIVPYLKSPCFQSLNNN